MIGFYHNFWTIFCGTGNGGAYVGESAAFHIFLNMLAVEEFSPYAYALHIALSKVFVYKSCGELSLLEAMSIMSDVPTPPSGFPR
jgi:hypothetical protein